MNKQLLKLCGLTSFLMVGQANYLSAQVIGDYRSKQSGNLTSVDTWEMYRGADSLWVPLANVKNGTPVPGSSSKMTIRNGHTVAIDGGTKTVRATFIEAGATLGTDGSTRNLRLVDSLVNNGTFGGTASNARLSIEGYKVNGTMYVGGTGSYYVGLIRTNGIVQTVDLVIDADLNVSQYITGPYTFSSGTNNSIEQGDDNVNIIINAGKTVTCGTAVYLHASSTTTSINTDFLGSYTYTINGTLDMTGSSTSCIVGHNTNNGTVTVNVNGTWKLGNAIRTASNNTTLPTGKVFLNIGTNGVVDATASSGTNLVMTNGPTGLYTFFNITGNGVLKQNPSKHASQNVFRVGTNDIYSPVTIGAATTPNATFSVGVAAIGDGGKKAVNRVWNISSSVIIPDLTLTFGSVAAIEKNGFNITEPVSVYNWNGSSWDMGVGATVGGDGTLASLHTAKIEFVNALGKFSVANETPVTLPLKFISFSAKASKAAKKVLLDWTTVEEKEVMDFIVERSTDGINFNQIDKVNAKNVSDINYYSSVDDKPYRGVAYYKVRQRDFDGTFSVSKIEYVNLTDQIVINTYPNPAINNLTVTHPLASTGVINVYSLDGKKVISNEMQVGSSSTGLDVAKLSPSIYLLEVKLNGETYSQKFTKN